MFCFVDNRIGVAKKQGSRIITGVEGWLRYYIPKRVFWWEENL